MEKMEEANLYNGYRINKYTPDVSHLMFADDLMFFRVLKNKTINTLQDVLFVYSSWSEQKTNFQRSSIHFSKGVELEDQRKYADMLGLKIMNENEKYLGVYLLKSDKVAASFNFLEDKMKTKMAGWKREFLNHTGRTILIQGVLALISPYYMASCLIPKKVLAKMTRIIRSFWWGHNTDQRKSHFIL